MTVEILTVEEVADLLRLSEPSVWRMLRQGKLPGTKVGSTWRIRRDLLDRWLDEHTTGEGAA